MQLVSIARALVHAPQVVLADEPTGNVNPAVGRSIMGVLRRVAKQRRTSVLMVTHSPEYAAWGDRVCFIQDGVVAAEREHGGDVENVAGIYDQLLGLDVYSDEEKASIRRKIR